MFIFNEDHETSVEAAGLFKSIVDLSSVEIDQMFSNIFIYDVMSHICCGYTRLGFGAFRRVNGLGLSSLRSSPLPYYCPLFPL